MNLFHKGYLLFLPQRQQVYFIKLRVLKNKHETDKIICLVTLFIWNKLVKSENLQDSMNEKIIFRKTIPSLGWSLKEWWSHKYFFDFKFQLRLHQFFQPVFPTATSNFDYWVLVFSTPGNWKRIWIERFRYEWSKEVTGSLK